MVKKLVQKTIIFGLIASLMSCVLMSRQNKGDEPNVDHYLDRVDDYFSQIPPDKILDWLIAREKRSLIKGVIDETSDKSSKTIEDKEAHFYEPKQPKSLSAEQKKLKIQERIAKKYIGKLPSQVNDVISYFSYHEKCIQNNIEIYNRLLLHGYPGTGKSHLVKVLGEQLEVPLLSFSASFFADKYIGEASRKIRKAFEIAKEYNKPILIFIDEIDALATKRSNEMHIEHRATLMTLLTELQEIQDNKNIFIFAATNDIEALDPAIKDRFAGSVCEIKELSTEERGQLFKKFFGDRGVAIDSKLALRLAQVTASTTYDKESKKSHYTFSNRDIEYIVTTALLKRFADYQDHPNHKKHLCAYVKEAIDATDKGGSFAWFGAGVYCDGI